MINRRTLLTSTAAAAGLAATGPAFAAAPMLGAARPSFRRVTLGGFEVTTLLDGASPVPEPQGIFGQEQTVATVEGLLNDNNLPTDMMEFTFSPVLVNTGTSLILFDTGNGAGARPGRGQLMTQIEAAGYTADQVDTVVITHMHPDHIGGMVEDGKLAFANANYVTGADEYNFWASTDRVGTGGERIHTMLNDMAPLLKDKVTLVKNGDAVTSGIEAMAATGHTPGHMIYHLESEGARMVLTADTANHFVLSLQRPDWEVRFDMDKAQAAATRKSVYGMLASEGVAFSGYHMPFPAMGYVEKRGEGFAYVPASYQLNI